LLSDRPFDLLGAHGVRLARSRRALVRSRRQRQGRRRTHRKRGWSLYGAPWSQPVANGGKCSHARNRENKRKPSRWIATGCVRRSMVRRGSTVRVRQRALQKPRTSGLLCSRRLAGSAPCGGYGAVYELSSYERRRRPAPVETRPRKANRNGSPSSTSQVGPVPSSGIRTAAPRSWSTPSEPRNPRVDRQGSGTSASTRFVVGDLIRSKPPQSCCLPLGATPAALDRD
jgi:hypothetical protein